MRESRACMSDSIGVKNQAHFVCIIADCATLESRSGFCFRGRLRVQPYAACRWLALEGFPCIVYSLSRQLRQKMSHRKVRIDTRARLRPLYKRVDGRKVEWGQAVGLE